MAIERRRVFFWGRVQGVGFRATARQLAGSFAIGGYVRNLDDGRVELVAEGEPGAISDFLQSVSDALGDRIQGRLADAEPPADPPLEGFAIRP